MNKTMVHQKLEQKILALNPDYFEVINESHKHKRGEENSHFCVTIVSVSFNNLSKIKRHQSLYALFSEELKNPIHALSLHLYTPEEWETQKQTFSSPNCTR